MKRTTPMKRTPFAPKLATRRTDKQVDYEPRPRSSTSLRAVVADKHKPVVSLPKFAYVRDIRLRLMCRQMPCQHCGASGPWAGVTWAHSNQAVHGKGGAVKASDIFVAALCSVCHRELDQGKTMNAAQRVLMWTVAHERTVRRALQAGTWPSGVALPDWAQAEQQPMTDAQDMAHLGVLRSDGGWMSAREVATRSGAAWHVVSFALRRLTEAGLVEEDVVDQAGRARSVEHQRVYRARPHKGWVRRVETTLPGWLAPQAVIPTGVSRMVMGSAGMQRWSGAERQSRGAPGGPLNGAASTKDSADFETAEESSDGG
jgi:DNA-binding transcriptional ArsR family regulator